MEIQRNIDALVRSFEARNLPVGLGIKKNGRVRFGISCGFGHPHPVSMEKGYRHFSICRKPQRGAAIFETLFVGANPRIDLNDAPVEGGLNGARGSSVRWAY